MKRLLDRARLARLLGFATAQVGVQVLGFLSGLVLVRHMAPVQYGYYTLAITGVGVANVLTELGVATAVVSIGGRLGADAGALGALVAEAQALHRRLAILGLCLLLPLFVPMLLHQGASAGQSALLAAMAGACAVLNVRNAIALSVSRLAGHLRLQQQIDLTANAARLLGLMAVATIALDATSASLLNLGAAAGSFIAWRRYLAVQLSPPPSTPSAAPPRAAAIAPAGHGDALLAAVRQQAPNCIYYVFSGQLAVWLIALFGNAERVAEVGALGRLGAGFAVIAAVMGAVVQPYFARHQGAAELERGFVAVNAFFAALLVALVALATLLPGPILWLLGSHYAGLGEELVWMILATALGAWSGALYTIGCGRGWVLPGSVAIGTGVLATLVGIRCFDLSTVAGNFKLTALTALVATGVSFVYVAHRLLRHRQAAPVSP